MGKTFHSPSLAVWLMTLVMLTFVVTCGATAQKLSQWKEGEAQLVDIYGSGHPLTARYIRGESPYASAAVIEFYDGSGLLQKHTGRGPWYAVVKTQLRDDMHEEIVGFYIDGTGSFINDIFVLGADEQGRIVALPVEIKTKRRDNVAVLFEQHDKELRNLFSGNPYNAALILRWHEETGKFVLSDNFAQIPAEPDYDVPFVLTKREGESLAGYTLMDRHWYREEGKQPLYDEATGEYVFRYGDAEVHAVMVYRNYPAINLIITDGPGSATDRGIKPGDPAEKVIEAYGKPLVGEYGDLLLYEYGCESMPDRILRFAVKKSTMTVDYISLRVTNIWQKVFPSWEQGE